MADSADQHPDSTPDAPNATDIPDGLSADYANTGVETAVSALQATPDYAHLAAFLTSLRDGYLVADITGSGRKKPGKQGPRLRTIRATNGQLVLPLFTSIAELRAAAPAADDVRGAMLPGRDALALISSDRFVAAEFNKASASLVVLRKYISLAAGDDPITGDSLEALR